MHVGCSLLVLFVACSGETLSPPPASEVASEERAQAAPERAPLENSEASRAQLAEVRALLEAAAGVGVERGEGQLVKHGSSAWQEPRAVEGLVGVEVQGNRVEPGELRGRGSVGARSEEGTTEARVRVGVRLEPIEVRPSDGTFDVALVAHAFRRHLGVFQRCVENLPLPPVVGLAAQVDVRIGQSGQATRVESLGDLPGQDCLASIARRMRWNPGPVGGEVAYRISVDVVRIE